MTKIRAISKARIDSLENLSNNSLPVDLGDLSHMNAGTNLLDLDRANSWLELAAGERVTSEPRKQSIDENSQLCKLDNIFSHFQKLKSQTVFLHDGKIITDTSNIDPSKLKDLDGEIIDNDWRIVWTLKGGQDDDGGAQNKQFREVMNLVINAPAKLSSSQEF
jgi:hypothetical protein